VVKERFIKIYKAYIILGDKMNILDYKSENHDSDVLSALFKKIKELVYFYKEFEVNIKDLSLPVDIDTFEGQQAMKDFLEIRVVEELMEMRQAVIENDRIEHVYEEVADSLNFLIASYVLYGWDETKFKNLDTLYSEREKICFDLQNEEGSFVKLDRHIMNVVYQIGITCNKLKIRPWKKSQHLTDMLIFEERFEELFYRFFNLIFDAVHLSPEKLWDVFSKKVQCNKFRIDTGY